MENNDHPSRNILRILAFSLVVCFFQAVTAFGQCVPTDKNLRKSAFIVGINRYDLLNDLHNPVYDAIDLTSALQRLHFSYKLDTNTNLKTLGIDFQVWLNSLDTCDIAIFYFAGHGAQNYLLPSNGSTAGGNALKRSGLRISDLLDSMKAHNHHLNIIVADACRNNPVMGAKNALISKGFGLMGSPGNDAMICFATGVGKTVDDLPNQRNSLYTGALLKYIELSKTPIRSILDKVHDEVVEDSQNGQDPWVNESGGSNFNHCLLVTGENDFNLDSTDAVLAKKYKTQTIPPSESRAAFFKQKIDTLMNVMISTRTDVVKELGDDLQPDQGGSGTNFSQYTFTYWLAIENIYSTSNAIWLKIEVSELGNTLNFIFSGDNRRYINPNTAPDYVALTEQKLNLKDTVQFSLSIFVTDWNKVRQMIRHYYLERAAALKPKYSSGFHDSGVFKRSILFAE